jgi:hypothetical protein
MDSTSEAAHAPAFRRDVKAFDVDQGRRRREQSTIQLRKVKKEESQAKRRAASAPSEETNVSVPSDLKLSHLPIYAEGK